MSKQEYEFGTFSIDADRSVVLRAGEEISLRRQSFDVLMYLVERPGQLVTKDGLVAAIWGNTAVTDNSLMQCMAEIRKALGDDDHQIVRTVVRRGYLFEPPTVSVQTGTGSESSPVYRLARVIVAVAVVLSVVAALITYFETDDVDRLGDNSIAMHTAATLEQDPSIALLKFDNLSIDNADQSFIDGVREEIAKQLGGVKRLRVISPLSVDRASRNGLAMQALGETLDVDYVLRGVGRRVQDRFRLTVQLFDAATDAQTWQESYDVELTADGLLDVEYEIAVAVATMLGIKMMPDFYVSKSEHGPANVEA